MLHSSQLANQPLTVLCQFCNAIFGIRSKVNSTIDQAIVDMKKTKNTTQTELITIYDDIACDLHRETKEVFEKADLDSGLVEDEFYFKLYDVVEYEIEKVNNAREPLDNIPEQMEAMRAQLLQKVDNLWNPEFASAKISLIGEPKRACDMCADLENKLARLREDHPKPISNSEKTEEPAANPDDKERLELEAKINDFPPGAVEDFCSRKKNIDKYKLIGAASVEVIRANTRDFAPLDLDPTKLDYKEWVDKYGWRFYSTVLKGTQTREGITRVIDKNG